MCLLHVNGVDCDKNILLHVNELECHVVRMSSLLTLILLSLLVLHVYLVLFKVIGIYEKNMSNHSFHGEG